MGVCVLMDMLSSNLECDMSPRGRMIVMGWTKLSFDERYGGKCALGGLWCRATDHT